MKRYLFLIFSLTMFLSACNTSSDKKGKQVDDPEAAVTIKGKEVEENIQPVDSLVEEKSVLVEIATDYGNMTVRLYNNTPLHRDNFIKLINEGWYENSPFHRIIDDFMIQGGQNADGQDDPGYQIPAEIHKENFHHVGALGAARTNNPEKASSGSQFYIVEGKRYTDAELDMFERRMGITFTEEQREAYLLTGGAPHLDMGYTVFGEVIEGRDVISKIAAIPTNANDEPKEPVTMKIKIVDNPLDE